MYSWVSLNIVQQTHRLFRGFDRETDRQIKSAVMNPLVKLANLDPTAVKK